MNRYAKIALAGAAVIAATATAAHAVGPGGGPGPMGGPGFGPCAGGPAAAEDGMGFGHRGHHGPWGQQANIDRQLGVDDVRAIVAGRLAMRGNKRLKVGNVQEKDADTVIAEIVTVDNSLVDRLAIDRHTGRPTPVR